jgi:hypothetical protein
VPGQRRQALVGELPAACPRQARGSPPRSAAASDVTPPSRTCRLPYSTCSSQLKPGSRLRAHLCGHTACGFVICTAAPRPAPAGHAHCVHDHVLGLLGVARLAVVRVMCPAHPARAACAAAGQHEAGVVPAVPLEQRRCLAPVCPVTVATVTRNGRHLLNGRHQQWPQ